MVRTTAIAPKAIASHARSANRIHIDVWLPYEEAEARIAAAIAAGGHLVSDKNAPEWWTLADAEGDEVDIDTLDGRD